MNSEKEPGTKIVSREEACEIVNAVKIKDCQFSAVSLTDCLKLLGAERFLMLMQDPIRKHGPASDSVYSWNLIDYLSNEDPRKKSNATKTR